MAKSRFAKGKGKVSAKICPVCGSSHCEEVVRKEIDTPKRTTWLCYSCGAGETTPPVK